MFANMYGMYSTVCMECIMYLTKLILDLYLRQHNCLMIYNKTDRALLIRACLFFFISKNYGISKAQDIQLIFITFLLFYTLF